MRSQKLAESNAPMDPLQVCTHDWNISKESAIQIFFSDVCFQHRTHVHHPLLTPGQDVRGWKHLVLEVLFDFRKFLPLDIQCDGFVVFQRFLKLFRVIDCQLRIKCCINHGLRKDGFIDCPRSVWLLKTPSLMSNPLWYSRIPKDL